MKKDLLEQIKALSNSKLGHLSALETFAHCLRSVYGKCSFVSFEPVPGGDAYQVRLVFSDHHQAQAHVDNLVDQSIAIRGEQLDLITHGQQATITEVSPELQSSFQALDLPVQSMMAIPLYLDGEIKRWVLILGEETQQFAPVDLEEATLLANLAATYMVRIDETQALSKANEWIEKELNDIGRLQNMLLPQQDINIPGADIASFFAACDRAGGDYYDIVNLSELTPPITSQGKYDAWGVIVADASGHGAAAAVEVAMFDAILRTYPGTGEQGAANVFNYANRHFFTRTSRGSFITAIVMGYRPDEGCLFYANAGHPPAIVVSPQNKLEYLNQDVGIPLGVDPDWQWQNAEHQIEPGSVIIAFTDGILEALSPAQQQYGQQRLEDVVIQCTGTAKDYCDVIVSSVKAHQADQPQMDDQAVVVVKIEE